MNPYDILSGKKLIELASCMNSTDWRKFITTLNYYRTFIDRNNIEQGKTNNVQISVFFQKGEEDYFFLKSRLVPSTKEQDYSVLIDFDLVLTYLLKLIGKVKYSLNLDANDTEEKKEIEIIKKNNEMFDFMTQFHVLLNEFRSKIEDFKKYCVELAPLESVDEHIKKANMLYTEIRKYTPIFEKISKQKLYSNIHDQPFRITYHNTATEYIPKHIDENFDFDPNSAEHQLIVLKQMIKNIIGDNEDEEIIMTYKLLSKRIELYKTQMAYFRNRLALLQKSYLLKHRSMNTPVFFNMHRDVDTSHVVTEDFYRRIIKYHNSSNKDVINTKLSIKNDFLRHIKQINENPIDIQTVIDQFQTNTYNKNTEDAIVGENIYNIDGTKNINKNVCVITYKTNGESTIRFNEEQETAFTYIDTMDYPEIVPDKKKSKKQNEAIALLKTEKLEALKKAARKTNNLFYQHLNERKSVIKSDKTRTNKQETEILKFLIELEKEYGDYFEIYGENRIGNEQIIRLCMKNMYSEYNYILRKNTESRKFDRKINTNMVLKIIYVLCASKHIEFSLRELIYTMFIEHYKKQNSNTLYTKSRRITTTNDSDDIIRTETEIETRINHELQSAHFTLNDITEKLCDNKAEKFMQYLSVPSFVLKNDRSSGIPYNEQIQQIIDQTLNYYSRQSILAGKTKYNYDSFVEIILYLTEKTFNGRYLIYSEEDAHDLLRQINLYYEHWFNYDHYDNFKKLVTKLEEKTRELPITSEIVTASTAPNDESTVTGSTAPNDESTVATT